MAARSVKQLALKVEKARQNARPESKEKTKPKAKVEPNAPPKGEPCPKCVKHPGKFIWRHTGEMDICYPCNGTGVLPTKPKPKPKAHKPKRHRHKRKTRAERRYGSWWSQALPVILLVLICYAAATHLDVPDWWGLGSLP